MATPQPFKEYVVKFGKGERIYSMGDPGTEMFIVQRGSVEIFKETSGERLCLAVMEKGDFFGEMALIGSTTYSTCAEARDKCELIEINSTLFDKMIRGNIEIAVRMLRKLSMRLREANRTVEKLTLDVHDKALPSAVVPSIAGSEVLEQTLVVEKSPIPPSSPATLSSRPVKTAPAAGANEPPPSSGRPEGCHSYFIDEEGVELFHLVGPRAIIGRYDPVTSIKPEVDLSSIDLNRSVSRHHARVSFEGGVYGVTEEVGALNGTFINGKKLVSGKSARLKTGDTLCLGMVTLIFKEV